MQQGIAEVTAHHEALEFRKAAAATRGLWAAGNAYFQRAAPWEKRPDDEQRTTTALVASLNLAAIYALIAMPFIPAAASRLLSHLGLPPDKWQWPCADPFALDGFLPEGTVFSAPPIPFSRVEDATIKAWEKKFGTFNTD